MNLKTKLRKIPKTGNFDKILVKIPRFLGFSKFWAQNSYLNLKKCILTETSDNNSLLNQDILRQILYMDGNWFAAFSFNHIYHIVFAI